MPFDIIEMFWGCVPCKAKNKGRDKTCASCGAPRTEASPEWMPEDTSPMAAVRDRDLLAKFKAGPDWHCLFCGSSQFTTTRHCKQCGSSERITKPEVELKKKAAQKKAERTLEAILKMPSKPSQSAKPYPDLNGGSYRSSPQRITVEPVEVPSVDPFPEDKVPFRSWRPDPRVLVGVGIALVVGLVLFLVFRTRIVDAKVTAVAWQRTVTVERYQINPHEGWSVPGDAIESHPLGSRVHHYDHVQVGSHQESYQELYTCGQTCTTTPGSCYTTPRSCTSNGNGSASCSGGDLVCSSPIQSCSPKMCSRTQYRTVADYEDQPRYQQWYAWKVWEWTFNRKVGLSGNQTVGISWPPPEQIALRKGVGPGEDERVNGRKETFKVTLQADETLTYEPKNEAEFVRFAPGSLRRVKVGVAHGVEVLP